ALSVDDSDANLWCKVGELTMRQNRLDVARAAFESGLEHASDFMAVVWRCLDGLCNVLFDLGDFPECLRTVNRALELNPQYTRGLWIKNQIIREHIEGQSLTSGLETDISSSDIVQHTLMQNTFDRMVANQPDIARQRQHRTIAVDEQSQPPLKLQLLDVSWLGLGQLLLNTYASFSSGGDGRTCTSVIAIEVLDNVVSNPNADLAPANIGEVPTIDIDMTSENSPMDNTKTATALHDSDTVMRDDEEGDGENETAVIQGDVPDSDLPYEDENTHELGASTTLGADADASGAKLSSDVVATGAVANHNVDDVVVVGLPSQRMDVDVDSGEPTKQGSGAAYLQVESNMASSNVSEAAVVEVMEEFEDEGGQEVANAGIKRKRGETEDHDDDDGALGKKELRSSKRVKEKTDQETPKPMEDVLNIQDVLRAWLPKGYSLDFDDDECQSMNDDVDDAFVADQDDVTRGVNKAMSGRTISNVEAYLAAFQSTLVKSDWFGKEKRVTDKGSRSKKGKAKASQANKAQPATTAEDIRDVESVSSTTGLSNPQSTTAAQTSSVPETPATPQLASMSVYSGSQTSLLRFIEKVSVENSGIVDWIRRYVLHFLMFNRDAHECEDDMEGMEKEALENGNAQVHGGGSVTGQQDAVSTQVVAPLLVVFIRCLEKHGGGIVYLRNALSGTSRAGGLDFLDDLIHKSPDEKISSWLEILLKGAELLFDSVETRNLKLPSGFTSSTTNTKARRRKGTMKKKSKTLKKKKQDSNILKEKEKEIAPPADAEQQKEGSAGASAEINAEQQLQQQQRRFLELLKAPPMLDNDEGGAADQNGEDLGGDSLSGKDGRDEKGYRGMKSPLTATTTWSVLMRWIAELEELVQTVLLSQETGNEGLCLASTVLARERMNCPDLALKHYQDALTLVAREEDDKGSNIVVSSCRVDNVISSASVLHKIQLLEARQYVVECLAKFDNADYQFVVDRLMPVLIQRQRSPIDSDVVPEQINLARMFVFQECSFFRRHHLMDVLYQSCIQENLQELAWVCLVEMFIDLVRSFVDRKSQFGTMMETALSLLTKLIEHMGSELHDILNHIHLVVGGGYITLLDQFIFSSFVLLRLSWVALMQLDEGLGFADLPFLAGGARSRPNVNKTQKLPIFIVRSWMIFASILRFLFAFDTENASVLSPSSVLEEDPDLDMEVVNGEIGTYVSAQSSPTQSLLQLHVNDHTEGEDATAAWAKDDRPQQHDLRDNSLSLIRPMIPASANVANNSPVISANSSPLRRNGSPSDTVDNLAEILIFAHYQLGALLKHNLEYISDLHDDDYQAEIHQCYSCLYGVCIKSDPDFSIDDHHTSQNPFQRKAATQFFSTLYPYALRKLTLRNLPRNITNELRECLEKVAEVCNEEPWKTNVHVAVNKEVIDHYLRSEVDLREPSPGRGSKLPLFVLTDYERARVSRKLAWMQVKARSQITKVKRGPDMLQLATDAFLRNVYMNPNDYEAWLALANAYVALANEQLSWNAKHVVDCFKDIREYQIATHFFRIDARHGLRNGDADQGRSFTKDIADHLWGNFGYLCHSMATKPMQGAAVARGNAAKVWDVWFQRAKAAKGQIAQPEITENQPLSPFRVQATHAPAEEQHPDSQRPPPEESVKRLLRIGAWCFKHAARLDATEWQYPFMIGKIYEKLGSDEMQILEHYKAAATLVPEDWTTKEQEKILDAHYKLASCLAKSLWKEKIKPDLVMSILDESVRNDWAVPSVQTATPPVLTDTKTVDNPVDVSVAQVESQIAAIAAPAAVSEAASVESESEVGLRTNIAGVLASGQDIARVMAFERILHELGRMKAVDKKKWQHKPTFRRAWIMYHVFNDVQRAKAELQSLFYVRSTTKNFASFWKPEFERPGKHFVYVQNYTTFFFELLSESEDLDILRVMTRKIRKADDMLLRPATMWTHAFACFVKREKGDQFTSHLLDKLSKAEFDKRAPEIESRMFAVTTPPMNHAAAAITATRTTITGSTTTAQAINTSGTHVTAQVGSGLGTTENKPLRIQALLRGFELKKLNDGDEDETQLEELMLDAYCSLFLEFGGLPPISEPPPQKPASSDGGPDAIGGDQMPPSAMSTVTAPRKPLMRADILRRVMIVCRSPPYPKIKRPELEKKQPLDAVELAEPGAGTATTGEGIVVGAPAAAVPFSPTEATHSETTMMDGVVGHVSSNDPLLVRVTTTMTNTVMDEHETHLHIGGVITAESTDAISLTEASPDTTTPPRSVLQTTRDDDTDNVDESAASSNTAQQPETYLTASLSMRVEGGGQSEDPMNVVNGDVMLGVIGD
ncbi:Histone transcription regulator 3, partial [Quaeritorhiza haematococci]